MQLKFSIAILFLLQCVFQSLYAQSDSTRNASWYFDDGGISESKNILKINVLSVITGDLPLYYERVISRSFTIEVGAGLLFPYFIPNSIQNEFDSEPLESPDIGYSIWIHPKIYLRQEAPELDYIGVQYRKRTYRQNGESNSLTDITLNGGLQIMPLSRMVFDFNIGLGISFNDENSTAPEDRIAGVAFPIGVKIGYIF